MRIGLIAEKTGVSRDTIRLYENMGLLSGITRPHEYNNYKEYSDENIERINFIRLMKSLGFSLNECKEVLTTIQEDKFDEEFQNNFLNQKIDDINNKINELVLLRDSLEKFRTCKNESVVEKLKKVKYE